MNRIKKQLYKLACKFNLHMYRVYGHCKDDEPIEQYEYHYQCVVCLDMMWDYGIDLEIDMSNTVRLKIEDLFK